MKLKKLTAMIIAAAMLSSLSVVAFAEHESTDSVRVTAAVQTPGNGTSASDQQKQTEVPAPQTQVKPQTQPQPQVQPQPKPQPQTKEKITISNYSSLKKPKVKIKKNGKVSVSWKKAKKKTKKAKKNWKKVKKIEIQYGTDKKFTTDVKKKLISKNKTSYSLGKLKKGKTYYLRMRYVDGKGGSSKWSSVRKIKT